MNSASKKQSERGPLPLPRNFATREELIVWDQKNVVIIWADGHQSCFSWSELRMTCSCEVCQQSREMATPERDAA